MSVMALHALAAGYEYCHGSVPHRRGGASRRAEARKLHNQYRETAAKGGLTCQRARSGIALWLFS